jgi:hypothetical protein
MRPRTRSSFEKRCYGSLLLASRRISTLLLWLVIFFGFSATSLAEQPSVVEVRALYLYNFSVFVRWPASTFEAPDSPIRYCVLGNRILYRTLEKLLKGESVQGHPLELTTAVNAEDWSHCQLLYLDHSLGDRIPRILAEVRKYPALTIGDTKEFPREGGMIGLLRKGRRVRPTINTETVAASGIRISSKLLGLANLIPDDEKKDSP